VERDNNDLSRYLLEPADQLFWSNRVGQDLNAGALHVIPKDAFQDGAHVDLLRIACINQQTLSPVDHPLGDTDQFFFFFQQQLPVGKRQPVQRAKRNIPQFQFVVVMPERIAYAQERGIADGCSCQEVFRRQVCLVDDVFDAPVAGFHQGV
jgi:hypothetical protein